MSVFTRRSIMRGALNGMAVCVAIPALDMFLDGNGKAFADGAKIPTRFGTYFWGLGLTPMPNGESRWIPKTTGDKQYEITPELEPIRGLEHKVSVMSGFKVHLDGKPNLQHFTGTAAVMTGVAPSLQATLDGPTFDTAVADQLGSGTRFRQVDIAPYGLPQTNTSRTGGRDFATADTSPLQLYSRLFGEGFQDPNSDTFTPDPQIMLRKSVLSAVNEQRQALLASVGAADRIKLDQYFTSVRQMEEQLAISLEKPAKCEACVVPTKPQEVSKARDITTINKNNKMMAELMAMGLACNQTKVFSVMHSAGQSGAYLPGDSQIYHLHTHDEAIDEALGYQPISSKLALLSFQGFGDFIRALDAIKEGDGTLLDHSLVMGYSDTGFAKIHSVDNIPMFFAGGAGGAHKGGRHVLGKGDPVSRVALTAQQLVGMPVGSYGVGGMKTTKTLNEVVKA